ncbi:MAG TPA: hypothetical protein VJR05_03455 [Acidimicrobiia bacterium]|nr:hypothetical protein [Acidimicrobiia bacterium]
MGALILDEVITVESPLPAEPVWSLLGTVIPVVLIVLAMAWWRRKHRGQSTE